MARDRGLSLVMPTVGRSPWGAAALAALAREVAALDQPAELLVVAQGNAARTDFPGADLVLRSERALGFAAANNWGFREARFAVVGTINDDAIVEQGFCRRLLLCLEEEGAAAAQGLNLQLGPDPHPAHPDRVDGAGIVFNGWGQAVQRFFGAPVADAETQRQEIFGVSATAAFYRADALEAVALAPGHYFDEELLTYYEDVELAIRLRAAGFRAFLEPNARTEHAGSASLSTLRFAGRSLIHGNRLLVLARLLGRDYWRALPRFLVRDAVDLARLLGRGHIAGAVGIALGILRALRHLPHYAHRRPRLLPDESLIGP